MVNLYHSNGEILIYNVDDWSVLRKEHRIVGEIVGNSLHIPSLPVKILPEEACLLISKNIATLLESPKEIHKTETDKANLEKYETNLLEAQIVDYKETRRTQIEAVVDKIKSKKNETRSEKEIIEDLLAKSPSVTKDNLIWPINFCSLNTTYQNLKSLTVDNVLSLTNSLKSAVYADLWNKGYFITQGHKFGGDFLVYFGDPVCHHAIFIIRCVDNEKSIASTEIVAFGRLGTSVKKRAVLASLVNGQVSYITINWIDA